MARLAASNYEISVKPAANQQAAIMAICAADSYEISVKPEAYKINFFGNKIHTTVTDAPWVVDSWISRTEHIHRHRLRHLVVGLDTEWRPSFSREFSNCAAILQLCVGHRCLIFQLLHSVHIPQSLIDFLGDYNYTFVGVGISQDAKKLLNEYGLEVANTVDLGEIAIGRIQWEHPNGRPGLKTLVKHVLGLELDKPKNIILSRWDKWKLTYPQIRYASIDAFVSFEIGRIWMVGLEMKAKSCGKIIFLCILFFYFGFKAICLPDHDHEFDGNCY